MSNLSVNYEYVLVIDPEIGEEAVKDLVEKFRSLIAESSDSVEVDEWGTRRLAYRINFKHEGYYVLYTYATSDSEFNKELERVSKITDHVLRWLVVKKDD